MAQDGLPRLVGRDAPFDRCHVDCELDSLRPSSDAHVSVDSRASSVLSGRNPVVAVRQEQGVVLEHEHRHGRQPVEHLGIAKYPIVIEVPAKAGR